MCAAPPCAWNRCSPWPCPCSWWWSVATGGSSVGRLPLRGRGGGVLGDHKGHGATPSYLRAPSAFDASWGASFVRTGM